MKILLLLAACALAIWGGYELARMQAPGRQPAPATAGSGEGTEALPSVDAKQRRIDRLRVEIVEQEKLVADLDRRLGQLDVGSGGGTDDAESVRNAVQAQADLVAALEARVRQDQQAISEGNGSLAAGRRSGAAQKQETIAELQARVQQDQQGMAAARDQLRNRVAQGLTVDQVSALNDQISAYQTDIANSRASIAQARAPDPVAVEQQRQISDAVASARADQGAAQRQLLSERQKLNALQGQLRKDDKSVNDGFTQRDRLTNQYQTARQKLQRLREELAALTGLSPGSSGGR